MKYAIQTSTLSQKWKLIWTSMSNLNLNSQTFRTLPKFAKFVMHALSHRNNLTEVSAVNLMLTGKATHIVGKSIVDYAYSHNIRQLTLLWSTRNFHEFPQLFSSSHTLKHLTLVVNNCYLTCHFPKSSWDFPALETLYLRNIKVNDGTVKSLDIFSKCVSLKELTLHKVCMDDVEIFLVCVPQLSNLKFIGGYIYPKVINMVAPQLQNLTAPVNGSVIKYLNSLQLSTQGFDSLEKVNLSVPKYWCNKESNVPILLNLFQKFRNTKFLILDVGIIESLSSYPDQLSLEPCPFDNLKSLKIDMVSLKRKDYITTIPTHVRNYLLGNSPSATVIMDLPKKRSR